MSRHKPARSSALFLHGDREPVEVVEKGVTRQILGFDEALMMARVCFDDGAIGYVHKHPHSQVTYVESGEFEFRIGDQSQRIGAGDCVYIPPDVEHGTVCHSAGVLLDVFSPAREDFLTEQDSS